MSFAGDVRSALPLIDAQALILHRDPSLFSVGHAHYLADHLAHARLVVLPGGDHLPYGANSDIVIDEIEEFLTGVRGGAATDRVLTTVLFTDIVGSTERAARSGDRAWHELLDSHDAMTRGELRRFRGREVKTTGDGLLATFDGPARAIRCAQSICAGAHRLGLEVRAGLHTGEVEVRGDDVGGIAVHLAQRVSPAPTRVRSSSRGRWSIWWPAQASPSRTEVSTNSRASRVAWGLFAVAAISR